MKVVHLIPYDATGGVEIAARSMRGLQCPDVRFSVQSIYAHVPAYGQRQVTYGVRPLLAALWRIRAQSPDLLIVSLWRACIVGALLKLLQPKMRLVLMLHSTQDAHWVDKVITRLTGSLADEWWGDSDATLNERLPQRRAKTKRVISFVTRRLQPVTAVRPSPHFVFWGRVSAIKGIDRAIQIFARVAQSHPDARFRVIGPDGGALSHLQGLVAALELEHAVTFAGEMDIADIADQARTASFYLQASKYEGMAMSVVEAMQFGLVPVVTPVGEIRNYCRNGENAVLIHSDDDAASQVLDLLADQSLYGQLRARAAGTWQGSPIYADSMLDACRAALKLSGSRPT